MEFAHLVDSSHIVAAGFGKLDCLRTNGPTVVRMADRKTAPPGQCPQLRWDRGLVPLPQVLQQRRPECLQRPRLPGTVLLGWA